MPRQNIPSIAVAGRKAHEAVSQVVLVHKRAELATKVRRVAHRTVPVADNGLGDVRSEVVGVVPADTLDGQRNVGGGHGVVPDPDLRSDEVGLRFGGGGGAAGRETGKVLLSKLNKLGMGDTAGTDKDHPVSSVVFLDVSFKVGALDALDVFLGTEDGPAEGLTLESDGVEVIKDNFLELLVNLFLLPENDSTFALNGRGIKLGVLQDISQDVDGLADVRVEALGVVDGVFALLIDATLALIMDGGKREKVKKR